MITKNNQSSSSRTERPPPSGGLLSNRQSVLCIAVASGKGGVGKTFFSVNLAAALATLGSKVLLVDADLGLPNADIVLGIPPEMTLEDALFRGIPMAEIVASTPIGIDLLAANSGARGMVSLGEARLSSFVEELVRFAGRYDVLLFDCASGINNSVTSFVAAAPQSIVVLQPEPTSLMDAYALIKVMTQEHLSGKVDLVINGVRTPSAAERILAQLTAVSRDYLRRDIECLGTIPYTDRAADAVRARKPLILFAPDDEASRAVRTIGRRILHKQHAATPLKQLDASGLLTGMLSRNSMK